MNSNIIELENVTKTFSLNRIEGIYKIIQNLASFFAGQKKLIALDNVSFAVSKGEVLVIIGRNGGGKTTLLRVISGIYTPDSGRVQVNGSMAPLLQIGVGFQNELDAKENIIISAMLSGMSKSEISSKVTTILEYAGLEEFSEMKLKYYSTGMRSRLAFSTAIQLDPDILLVDEVLAVGDQEFRKKSFKEFISFKQRGKTVIYTTHNLDSVLQLADRVLLIDKGKVIMIGNPQDVIQKYNELTKK